MISKFHIFLLPFAAAIEEFSFYSIRQSKQQMQVRAADDERLAYQFDALAGRDAKSLSFNVVFGPSAVIRNVLSGYGESCYLKV